MSATTKRVIANENNQPAIELAELLFFAYRSFTSEPDKILEEYNFGRAHHRVLHFVARNSGISVAELLNILLITKQSLAPVLKELVDGSFIIQKIDSNDRRRRLLYLTKKGEELTAKLLNLQVRKISKAIAPFSTESQGDFKQILKKLAK